VADPDGVLGEGCQQCQNELTVLTVAGAQERLLFSGLAGETVRVEADEGRVGVAGAFGEDDDDQRRRLGLDPVERGE
jgi:hypothetical protein